jgi:hypothetical protein
MSLSKRQKKLLAVFLVGIVALVADRAILRPQGGPRAASADFLASSPNSVPLSAGVPAAPDPPPPAGVAQRLDRLAPTAQTDSNALRDPFSLPDSWSDHAPAGGGKGRDAAGGFALRHRLQAVVMQGPESYALVDDNVLVRGQYLDGCRLVSIGDRSAVFERDGKRIVLELVSK